MNLAALEKRVWERLEQDPLAPVTPEPVVLHALNQAYLTFVLLTLCLEKTATITLAAGKPIYGIRNLLPDYLRPLRVTSGDPVARLRPCSFRDLDALDTRWQDTNLSANPVDPPSRYFTVGCNLFGVWRQPTADVSADVTYAYLPPPLAAGGDVPLTPEEYHESLVKFALVWVRLPEGAGELAKVTPLLGEFLADAAKLGGYVKARSVAAAYDSLPFEIKAADISRLVKGIVAKGAADAKPAAG